MNSTSTKPNVENNADIAAVTSSTSGVSKDPLTILKEYRPFCTEDVVWRKNCLVFFAKRFDFKDFNTTLNTWNKAVNAASRAFVGVDDVEFYNNIKGVGDDSDQKKNMRDYFKVISTLQGPCIILREPPRQYQLTDFGRIP
jgi:hypothetical protein